MTSSGDPDVEGKDRSPSSPYASAGLEAGVQDPEGRTRLEPEQRADHLSELETEAGESRIQDFLPFLAWGRDYGIGPAGGDLLAGSLVALLLLPQAMAYAQLAELPPAVGFYAALVPTLGYALLGSARFLSIGPVALVSLLAGESLAQAVDAGFGLLDAALVLAAISGLVLIAGALVGIARLADFLGRPVLDGFATAAALLIASSQMRPFLGIDGDRASGFLNRVEAIVTGFDQAHMLTAITGAACLALLLLGGWGAPKLARKAGASGDISDMVGRATPLVVLSAACAAVAFLDLDERGVEVIGDFELGVPPVGLPSFDLELWQLMLPGGLVIALVTFVVGLALGQSLAGRDDRVDARQEMLGMGFANALAAVSGGYPVGASVSRSSVLRDAGARSPLAAALAGVLALALAFLAAPVVALLPKAALAALILSAALGMIDVTRMRRTWKIDRRDGLSLAITFLAVLVLGVDQGLVAGIVAGLILHLWRASRPKVVIQGWKDSSKRFADAARESVMLPEVSPLLLARVDGAIDFSNARHVRQRLFEELYDHPEASCLVLDLRSSNEIDGTAMLMLDDLIRDLARADVIVAFAETKQRILEKMRTAGLIDVLGEDHWFDSTAEAMEVMKQRCRDLESCES